MKTLLCAAAIFLSSSFIFAQQYSVLWTFGGAPNDGALPTASLVFDETGNLYGTTSSGGSGQSTGGTVFELSSGPTGWTETVLYNFCSSYANFQCLDGTAPKAGLVFDGKGNLFGTTNEGGNQTCPVNGGGCGTVFELSPPLFQGGAWTETVLYNFCSNKNFRCGDGALPTSQLVFDASGNLYGTTTTGGSGGSTGGCCLGGTVFELSRGAGGWTESVLYNFCANGDGDGCLDGTGPHAGVTFDKAGNLYGTTEAGGIPRSTGGGTVYKLSPSGSGWTETVLYSFAPPYRHGASPLGAVSFDPLGNLYGTFSSGQNNFGGVFRLSPKGGGHYSSFMFSGKDGALPAAGVLVDAKHGALYGTTSSGLNNVDGTVFQLVGNGQETVLHSFCSGCADGDKPVAGLIEDRGGNLYGTAELGGVSNVGVVFEIIQPNK